MSARLRLMPARWMQARQPVRFLQYSVRRIRLSVGRIRFAAIFFKL
jgi:hypothetical protein